MVLGRVKLATTQNPPLGMKQKRAVRLAFLRSWFDTSSHPTYSDPKGRRVTTAHFLAASASASALPESRLGCAPRGLVQSFGAVTLLYRDTAWPGEISVNV